MLATRIAALPTSLNGWSDGQIEEATSERKTLLGSIFEQAESADGSVDLMRVGILEGDREERLNLVRGLNVDLGRLKDAEGSKIPPLRSHPGHPKPRRRSLGTSRRPGAGRFESFGHEVLDSLTQGGKLMAALDVTVGGTALPSFFDPDLREMPQRRLFLRDLISTMSVTSDRVDYVCQTVNTHAAAAVAAGAQKPRSTYSIERVTASVQTIAHMSEAIDRALLADSDAVVRFLNDVLVVGVVLEEEDQVLQGDGTPPNLRGILNTIGIQTQAKGTDPHFDAIFKALTKIRMDNFEPDGIVLHPNDWQEIRLTRTADGKYIHGDPLEAGEERLFDKPVVVSPLIPEGTGLVGAFQEGCTVYDRESARVTFAETGLGDTAGEELFDRNEVRFRGESRIAFGVAFPRAFCSLTSI